jgi:hypothetical protein
LKDNSATFGTEIDKTIHIRPLVGGSLLSRLNPEAVEKKDKVVQLFFLLPVELHQHLYADNASALPGPHEELEGLEELLAQPLGTGLFQ